MKRKLVSILTGALAVGTLAACGTSNQKTVDLPLNLNSSDMDKSVDANDNLKSEEIYASPDVSIEYDFEKELNDEKQSEPKHKGTKDDPYDIYTALHKVGAGDTLYLKSGTYKTPQRFTLSQSGNAKRLIKVKPADTNARVTLDFSDMEFLGTNRGIQLFGNYWVFDSIDIKGAGDNGMYIGGSFNTILNSQFYENRDTGLQLGRSSGSQTSITQWPHNNLIKNCTSFNNYDDVTLGENADGFAAKLTVGEGNVFDGCIAYRNSDDGWDMYAKPDSGKIGTTVLINCIAFENGWILNKAKSNTKDRATGELISSYMTQNGDGNGFKLGGSTMTGSVIADNCLAFNNRMAGFADNSNPGVIYLSNCTAFNNSVYMSMTNSTGSIDPTGDTGAFGANDGENANYAMARTEESYNAYKNLLSYSTNMTNTAITYANYDKYRGSAEYCIFNTGMNSYSKIESNIDSSAYKKEIAGSAYTEINNDSFESLDHGLTINGNTTIHFDWRNPDGSINIGNFLKVKGALATFNNGKPVGCELDKKSDSEYRHYSFHDLEGLNVSNDSAKVAGAYDVLEVMCNPKSVYQNLGLLTTVNELFVSWSSSDESLIKIGYEETESISEQKEVVGIVKRPSDEDKEVTLTATIASGKVVLSKDFVLTVKKEVPTIGKFIGFESKYIVNQFDTFNEPTVITTDANSYANQALDPNMYTLTKNYYYAESAGSKFVPVSQIYTSVAGVYKVEFSATQKNDQTKTITDSYQVFVRSDYSPIDISTSQSLIDKYAITPTDNRAYQINTTRDGVKVSAIFTNVYGYLYVATSNEDNMELADVIANGQKFDIEDEFVEVVANANNTSGYNVFVAVTNRSKIEDKLIHSDVYKATINYQEISTNKEFYDLVTKQSSPTTIYSLTQDLDFADFTFTPQSSSNSFRGTLNGNNHTIKNVTITGTASKHVNMIYKLANGTIMNVNFENISITTDEKNACVGIVGQMTGGYIDNVALKNVKAIGGQGVAALVGQMAGGSNYINNVSLVNPLDNHEMIGGVKYFGGIVGNFQKDTAEYQVRGYLSNIYVNAYIGTHNDSGYVGGIVGRNKNEFDSYHLEVTKSYMTGVVDTNYTYSGGIIGSVDSAAGYVSVTRCVADIKLVLKDTIVEKGDLGYVAQKNNSPIIGRCGYLEGGNYLFFFNFGAFTEYSPFINSDSSDIDNFISTSSNWTNVLQLDTENVWEVIDEAPYCILRNSK